MPLLSTPLLAPACRIFMDLAYPDGPQSIPDYKQCYTQIPADAKTEEYLCPAPRAHGICQKLADDCYTFRLGSKRYANLKMKVQCLEEGGVCHCVFAVDTHDAFSKDHTHPPKGHPDAPAWLELQAVNGALKTQIEAAWDAAGILTHNGLLRAELHPQVLETLRGSGPLAK